MEHHRDLARDEHISKLSIATDHIDLTLLSQETFSDVDFARVENLNENFIARHPISGLQNPHNPFRIALIPSKPGPLSANYAQSLKRKCRISLMSLKRLLKSLKI